MILVPDILPPERESAGLSPLPDPVALLLADKRSPATRRAYRGDLVDFFGGEPTPAQVREFVSRPEPEIAGILAAFKSRMIARALSEATVNRRLAAVRSLLAFCRKLGFSVTDGKGLVEGERVTPYRDTRGISLDGLKRLLAAPEGDDLRARRDRAMLRILAENALRRGELCALDVADFSIRERRLWIRGKGKGTQKAAVTISERAAREVGEYLIYAGHTAGALFRNLDRRTKCDRLSAAGLYDLVKAYGSKIGEKLSPHKIRHSAITGALDLTSGDVRRVQKLSRHAKIDTLLLYDDARSDLAGGVVDLLSGALGR